MKVYTKTGDGGQTSLLSKQRVNKDSDRVSAYGTVDEASAAMGLAKSLTGQLWAIEIIQQIQTELIDLNADLATNDSSAVTTFRIGADNVKRLESLIDSLEERRIPQHYFVTPGTTSAGAALDLARTIVRRAERLVVRLKRSETVPAPVGLYLNRLSDLLFVLARCVEQEELIQAVTGQVMKALAPQPEAAASRELSSGILAKAKVILAAAEQKAVELGIPMVIAVVDEGGNLVAQYRMDGALLASVSLALDKAYTAVALKMPTEQVAALVVPGQPLYGLHTASAGRFVVFGGGIPILKNGCLAGGIGVSGGTVEEDIAVAEAGLAAW